MATIASLSPETLAQILSYIPRDHDNLIVRLARIRDGGPIKPVSELPPYATVCKTWQWHIEQRTFREINLPSSELAYFSKLMTGHRRATLREVKYQVALPEYDDAACAVVETEEDKRVNDASFTTAITELFRLVKRWEEEDEQELSRTGSRASEGLVPLSLEMSQIYSPSDPKKRSREILSEQHRAVERGERRDLFEGRYCDSWLRLGPLDGVPELKRVTKYAVSPSYPRPVEAESIARLAKKFPALEKLDLQIMERSEDFEVRRKDRYDFAVALLSLSSLPLTSFSLCAENTSPRYQFQEPPSILLSDIDHFSLALYAISLIPTLKTIDLQGPIMISPQLFQPPAALDSAFASLANRAPQWPSLRTYSAIFSTVRPSGSWYFVRHPNNPVPHDFVAPLEPEFDSDRGTEMFRTYPDDEAMDGLLAAAGKAKQNMPALQMMSLTASLSLENSEDAEFEAVWFKAGQKNYLDHRLTEQPVKVGNETFIGGDHVYWWTGKGGNWRPKRKVEKAWVGEGNQQWFKGYPQEEDYEEDEEDEEDYDDDDDDDDDFEMGGI
ncbi:hypothetical protein VE01_05177 [Pseudogymnoascus verrucosus]|uniref:F-box domain-containing protein n=1 Tax=Pseudogymnoascus verrucosus TaxID=342668 RepID=A0A1B8GI00_9PEZI|nr:uncharacterized protein VE01_05177 [Pseudogymnoascus verrucosus]OBT95472.1 hypothetical protein VE01_05177 [Pseudogymnoascus verrucosus]